MPASSQACLRMGVPSKGMEASLCTSTTLLRHLAWCETWVHMREAVTETILGPRKFWNLPRSRRLRARRDQFSALSRLPSWLAAISAMKYVGCVSPTLCFPIVSSIRSPLCCSRQGVCFRQSPRPGGRQASLPIGVKPANLQPRWACCSKRGLQLVGIHAQVQRAGSASLNFLQRAGIDQTFVQFNRRAMLTPNAYLLVACGQRHGTSLPAVGRLWSRAVLTGGPRKAARKTHR